MKLKIMMRNISLISLLIIFAFANKSFAQSRKISAAVLKKFSAGICMEVTGITNSVALTEEQQLRLAAHFAERDSLKLHALLNNTSASGLLIIDSVYSLKSSGLLAMDAVNKVITDRVAGKAALETELAINALPENIRNDPRYLNFARQYFTDRATLIEKNYALYGNTPQFWQTTKNAITRYDSLIQSITEQRRANYYAEDLLETLDSIKPFPDNRKNAIRRAYIKNINSKSNLGYGDHFIKALRSITKDTAYFAYLYKDEIERMTKANTGREMLHAYERYKTSRKGLELVGRQIAQREQSRAKLFYTMPNGSPYKDSLSKIVENYYDSLIMIALYNDGNFPHTTQFATAVKNRDKLFLRVGQTDTLIKMAVALERDWNNYETTTPLGKFDPKPYEARYIQPLLSDDQYMKMLEFHYETQAREWAIGDWNELRQRKLTDGLDSLFTVYEISKFNSSRLALQARYADDKPMMYAQIKALDANIPASAKKLKAARGADTPETLKQKSVQLNLRW